MIPANYYHLIRTSIFTLLTNNKELSLTELLEKARPYLAEEIKGDLGWYLLTVKMDLEARGLVEKKIRRHDRSQIIRLTYKAKKLLLSPGTCL